MAIRSIRLEAYFSLIFAFLEPEPERLLSADFTALLLAVPPGEVLFGLLGVLLLLVCSALISGSEIAFFSLTHNDHESLQQEGDQAGQRIIHLVERPRKLLATILISNNFINIAIVILSDFVLLRFISEETFLYWGQSLSQNIPILSDWLTLAQIAWIINFLMITVGITFLLVLFGEVAPKVYARINNVRLARFMSLPLMLLLRLFNPISTALVNLTNVMEKRLANASVGNATTSREEIDDAIELTVSMEEDTEQEVDILKSIVKFGEVSVKQIMRSRVDVVAVDFRMSYPELLDVVRDSGYSRIPVYENDFDNVTGILYVKDLLGHLPADPHFEWQTLIRTNVLYVPEAKKIDDLLKEFQRKHLHLAIVVDEYGGSSGIVTLEDIMEEIIGEIKDEFDDEPEILYQKIDDSNFLFEGKTLINDACRVLGLDTAVFEEARGESDSLAGLLLELHGGIPKVDEEIPFEAFTFKVTAANERRIEQVLFTLPEDLKYYRPEERS